MEYLKFNSKSKRTCVKNNNKNKKRKQKKAKQNTICINGIKVDKSKFDKLSLLKHDVKFTLRPYDDETIVAAINYHNGVFRYNAENEIDEQKIYYEIMYNLRLNHPHYIALSVDCGTIIDDDKIYSFINIVNPKNTRMVENMFYQYHQRLLIDLDEIKKVLMVMKINDSEKGHYKVIQGTTFEMN